MSLLFTYALFALFAQNLPGMPPVPDPRNIYSESVTGIYEIPIAKERLVCPRARSASILDSAIKPGA